MSENDGYLTGKLLLAMPGMQDPRFERTVIYICAHSEEGAMGLVINRPCTSINFPDLLEQLDIEVDNAPNLALNSGGPVETGRGFVLHTSDYMQDSTLAVSDQIALTATVDILTAIAQNRGPRSSLVALGYAGWGPDQLEGEIQSNGWLTADTTEDLLFRGDLKTKWPRAMASLGIDISMLSSEAGHA